MIVIPDEKGNNLNDSFIMEKAEIDLFIGIGHTINLKIEDELFFVEIKELNDSILKIETKQTLKEDTSNKDFYKYIDNILNKIDTEINKIKKPTEVIEKSLHFNKTYKYKEGDIDFHCMDFVLYDFLKDNIYRTKERDKVLLLNNIYIE